MSIIIRSRWDSSVIRFKSETATTLAEAIAEAKKMSVSLRESDLSGSDLRGSNLRESDLSGSNLHESDLSGSDLRGSNLRESDLSGSNLRGSDLRGSDLRGSNLRESDLSGSNLRGSDLSESNLSESNLRGSDLRGSNLRGSDLSESDLSWSDLRGSDLSGSDLSGSNLSGCLGLSLENIVGKPVEVPVIPNIHQAVLAAIQKEGCRLNMGAWHSCETTHCRAGWVVHLAGEAGKRLEDRIGTPAAARRIYRESDPSSAKGMPFRFYCTTDEAMADIIKCAEQEKAKEAAPA